LAVTSVIAFLFSAAIALSKSVEKSTQSINTKPQGYSFISFAISF
jgi:hypothetical protein